MNLKIKVNGCRMNVKVIVVGLERNEERSDEKQKGLKGESIFIKNDL